MRRLGPELDLPTRLGISGVAGRGGDDGAGRAVPARVVIVQVTVAGSHGQFGQVVDQQGQHRLSLGVAEAAVELEQPRSVGGEHQPGVEHADVGRADGREVVDHWLDERCRQQVRVVGDRRRGVGAHAARVRAGVALADALVILRHRQGAGHLAVAQRHQAALRSGQPLLEHDWALGHQLVDRGDGLVITVGHDHALTGGEAVELDHHWLGEATPPGDCFVGRGGEVERG